VSIAIYVSGIIDKLCLLLNKDIFSFLSITNTLSDITQGQSLIAFNDPHGFHWETGSKFLNPV
jgi:hypothetical protein